MSSTKPLNHIPTYIDLNLNSQKLHDLLQLEVVDELIYRSTYTSKTRSVGIYGGQIVSQAMAASDQTVDKDRIVHSIHTYFILTGDNKKPVIYHVEKVRDGRTFTTRLVKAIQNGRHIFSCILSYQKPEEYVYTHQVKMPSVPPPESLPLYEEVLKKTLKDNRVTDFQRAFISQYIMEESLYFVKPVDDSWMKFFMEDIEGGERRNPMYWIKFKSKIDSNRQDVHRWLAGYISDSYLMQSALIKLPWAQYYPTMMVSLDHSLWFHCDFQVDEWMLYECECPRYENNRALTFGRMWKRDGTLAVSMAQEGLLRINSML